MGTTHVHRNTRPVARRSAARADGLDQFNATVEAFSAHHRVALAYLRTGNFDLASVELERMQAAWQEVVTRFGNKRPAEITDQALYTSTLDRHLHAHHGGASRDGPRPARRRP